MIVISARNTNTAEEGHRAPGEVDFRRGTWRQVEEGGVSEKDPAEQLSEEGSYMIWGREECRGMCIPGRGNSTCKGPEAELHLWKEQKEASLMEAW